MLGQGRAAKQRRRQLGAEQAFEYRARRMVVDVVADLAGRDLLRDVDRIIEILDLDLDDVGVGAGKDMNQRVEVARLIDCRRVRHGVTERLAHTAPILVHVIAEAAQCSGPAAHQPAEFQATEDVAITPAPLVVISESRSPFVRKQARGDLWGEKALKQRPGLLDLLFGRRRIFSGGPYKRRHGCRVLEFAFENWPIGAKESAQNKFQIAARGSGTSSSLIAHDSPPSASSRGNKSYNYLPSCDLAHTIDEVWV